MKFTKEGGTIEIVCEFIRGIYKVEEAGVKAYKSKLLKMYQESFSSDNEKNFHDSDSVNSEASKFERDHKVEALFEPMIERDKIVLSVIDTGIGIKKKDRIKLFKLFG